MTRAQKARKRIVEGMSLMELAEMYANHRDDEVQLLANMAKNELERRDLILKGGN